MSEKKPIKTTEKTLHRDEMLTLKRRAEFIDLDLASAAEVEQFVAEQNGGELPLFDEALYDALDRWTTYMHGLGLPSPTRLVRVSRGADGQERCEELPAEEVHNLLALVPTGAGHVEYGAEFIQERTEPLSVPWWLARLSIGVTRILEEKDPDLRLYMALELGRDQRKFEEHHAC